VKRDEMQMGFMPRKGTIDALRQMMENMRWLEKHSAWYLLTWKRLLIESKER